jgi:hypothetical protein
VNGLKQKKVTISFYYIYKVNIRKAYREISPGRSLRWDIEFSSKIFLKRETCPVIFVKLVP